MVYLDECYYHYRKINTSITNSYRENLEKKWAILFKEMRKILKEKNLGEKYQKAFMNRVALSIIGIGMNEVGNNEKPHWWRYRKVRNYLKSLQYQKACKQLNIRNMPIIWKIFFCCCKMKLTMAVYCMLLAIMQLRKM